MSEFNFKPGFVTNKTAEALNELQRAKETMSRLNTPRSFDMNQTAEEFWVYVSANSGGTPPVYTWTEQIPTGSGAFANLPGGRSGSPTDKPLYEENGLSISAPFYTRVDRAIIVNGVAEYIFKASAISSTLEVRGRTGSIANVTDLTLANGVLTGTASAALWTPDVADLTLAGIVSIVAQVFGGAKTFHDGLEALYNASLDGGTAAAFGTQIILRTAGDLTGTDIFRIYRGTGHTAELILTEGSGSNTCEIELWAGTDPVGASKNAVVFGSLGSLGDPDLWVGSTIGVSGSLGPGATSYKGLISSLGSGSFGDVTSGGSLTNHGIILGTSGHGIAATAALTDNQFLVGVTGADPAIKTAAQTDAILGTAAGAIADGTYP